MRELAVPNPFLAQLDHHFSERRSGLKKPPCSYLSPPRACSRIAPRSHDSIREENHADEFPHENGYSRKVQQAFLLTQLALALPQRLLHMAPLRDIDECDDDAIDLVIDGPVRTDAHVVPPISAALDFPPNGCQVREHLPAVDD
jgi:hypothetical protein